jgi:hypothetical protein
MGGGGLSTVEFSLCSRAILKQAVFSSGIVGGRVRFAPPFLSRVSPVPCVFAYAIVPARR